MFDITLTFDNGPEPAVTTHVLGVLAAYRLRSTFFVIGKKLLNVSGRKILERALSEGHWVGNHTWSHSVPLGQTSASTSEHEIRQTQLLLNDLALPNRLFRPIGNGGTIGKHLLNAHAIDVLCEDRFTCVLWNCVPRDWESPDNWVEVALEQCRLQKWSLVVLHDLPTGAMQHLSRFLDVALSEGAKIRQDFPPDCLPIVKGEIVRPLTPYVSAINATSNAQFDCEQFPYDHETKLI